MKTLKGTLTPQKFPMCNAWEAGLGSFPKREFPPPTILMRIITEADTKTIEEKFAKKGELLAGISLS